MFEICESKNDSNDYTITVLIYAYVIRNNSLLAHTFMDIWYFPSNISEILKHKGRQCGIAEYDIFNVN